MRVRYIIKVSTKNFRKKFYCMVKEFVSQIMTHARTHDISKITYTNYAIPNKKLS